MPLNFLDDPGFSTGMVRDEPSWLIPAGGTYDQLNMLNDQQGIARMRMGSTALVSGAQTAFATSIGFAYSNDPTPIEELYGYDGKAGGVNVINKASGAATSLGTATASVTVGRPVRHFGFLVFPSNGSAPARRVVAVAGQTSSTTFASGAVASVTAGNPTVTLTGADVTTNVKVGAVVLLDAHATTNEYYGRVVAITGATTFTVWPVPSFTDAAVTLGGVTTRPFVDQVGGTCVSSFQNRLLVAGGFDLGASSLTIVNDRRVYYSPLPTEATTIPTVGGGGGGASGYTLSGASFINALYWPKLNYFEVPGSDPIIAMEPISDGELLVLTSKDLVIFNGVLATQLATTSPTITFEIYPLGTTYGCLSDLSVHRTPVGIMWAGNEGVFAYWPPLRRNPAKTGVRNLMEGKILSYWQNLANPSAGSFVIHGSAYVRNHYIISGTSNGVAFSLACNLHNDQWTRLSGVGTDVFVSVAQPSIPQRIYAARWWDQTGAAPSMTNGQTLRLESMIAPYAGGTTTDADGSAITMSLTTRTVTGDAELQKLFQRGTVRYQESATTAAVTVTAQSKLDAADISSASVRTLGSLSNTSVLTVTAATNANPIVVTTSANHGLQSDDFVDLDGITGNTNGNGRWRISVLSNTTFSLLGPTGNGVMGGSPTCKKLTETDFLMSSLNAGQGVSYKLDGAPNNFELHATRTAVLQRDPVSSA